MPETEPVSGELAVTVTLLVEALKFVMVLSNEVLGRQRIRPGEGHPVGLGARGDEGEVVQPTAGHREGS